MEESYVLDTRFVDSKVARNSNLERSLSGNKFFHDSKIISRNSDLPILHVISENVGSGADSFDKRIENLDAKIGITVPGDLN